MLRSLLELLIPILVLMVARSVLSSIVKEFGGAAANATGRGQQGAAPSSAPSQPTGELHKDPVCGTYISESTPHRRQLNGKTVYYCSEACKQNHQL